MYKFVPSFIDPKGSPIRQLFKYTSQPGMISFAGGSPASSLFDVKGLERAAHSAYQRSNVCLQYGATSGSAALRGEIIKLMEKRGAGVNDNELLITTGSQQGLDLFLRVAVAPGENVLVEVPAYAGTLQALKLHGANIHPVPTDTQGLDVDALEQMLASDKIQPKPKMLYTVPTFANPTGATLTLERRLRLLELMRKYRILIVEDDPYGQLRFKGDPIPSLLSLSNKVEGSRQWVVHLSSLSKIVAPGLRVGWTIADQEIIRRCVIAKETADLCSSPWIQEIATDYLKNEDLEQHIQNVSVVYGAKCRTMCTQLTDQLGENILFSEPEGGLFVWAKLSRGVRSDRLLEKAIEQNVMFVPGNAFYVENPDYSTLRLSYATADEKQIQDGVNRLSKALK